MFLLAAADRLHDLDAVAFLHDMCGVLAARHDLAIAFDRDPALAVAGELQQLRDAGRGRQLQRLAVEGDADGFSAHGRNDSAPFALRRRVLMERRTLCSG